MGPYLLFAFAMDDVDSKCENSIMVKFADDITLLHFIRNGADDRIVEEMQHINEWSNSHGMALNYDKTKIMNFVTKRSLQLVELRDPSSGVIIEAVRVAKLLGIMIDDQFSWKSHIDNVLSRVKRRIYCLYSLKKISTSSVLWMVYCALLRSVLSYAYPAWCSIGKTRFSILSKFEMRLSRIFGFNCPIVLKDFCNQSAAKLAKKADSKDHPLNFIYETTAVRYSGRLGKSHRRVKAKTVRFKESFVKYA